MLKLDYMEGDNNLQMQPGPTQAANNPAPAEQTVQTSIDPNKPAVRRRRGWEKIALPLLLILGIGVVVVILIVTLNVTGVINGGNSEDDGTVLTEEEYEQLVEDLEGVEMNPYMLMTFEDSGEGFLNQIAAYEYTGDVSEYDLAEFQDKVAEYLDAQEDTESSDYVLATKALARAYFLAGMENEGITLLENAIARSSSDANKVYYYITLYDYYTRIEDDEKRLATINQIVSFPEDIVMEEDDYYAIVDDYRKIANGIMGVENE